MQFFRTEVLCDQITWHKYLKLGSYSWRIHEVSSKLCAGLANTMHLPPSEVFLSFFSFFPFFLSFYFCIYFHTTSFVFILFLLSTIEESCNSNANETYIKLSRRFFSWTQTFSLFVYVSIKRLENKRQKHREETKKVNISEWIYT